MKLENDCIRFTDRDELDVVIIALEEWLKEHNTDSKKELVQGLKDKLDAMYIGW